MLWGLIGGCFFDGTWAQPKAGALVMVAGATGRTGQDVVEQLLAGGYRVRGLVRDRAKAEEMFGSRIEYAVGDVRESGTLPAAMKGADYVICVVGSSPDDPANSPEAVDYGGVRNLTDAAKAAGVKQFVLMSSMGVTQPDEPLNPERRGTRPGVRQWKLKGEDYLRASGVVYTIVRSAGLGSGPGGTQGIIASQGDKPIAGDPRSRMIPRADVAAVEIRALGNSDAYNKTFEVMGDPSARSVDWPNFFKQLQKDKH